MKSTLIDASSAILLYKAGLFRQVAEAYRLCMVPTVFREITVEDRLGAALFKRVSHKGKIHVLAPLEPSRADVKAGSLHAGEMETIIAFDKQTIHFIIMDDGKGARVCRDQKIPYINALLCPNILYLAGRIDSGTYHCTFEHLQRIGRYGKDVVRYARSVTRRRLVPFLP